MKIAILTLNTHNNYGNRLQNYALQVFLSKFNCINQVNTIWFEDVSYLPDKPSCWKRKVLFKWIFNKNKQKIYKKDYGLDCIRQYNIKKFSDKYISIKYVYRIPENLNDLYDYFVIGSDQVWAPTPKFYKERFLSFASSEKRISYAASFGVDKLPENKKNLFKEYLSKMKSISVREKAGAKIVYELIKKDVPILVDPTMLLSKEEWRSISLKPEWYVKGSRYLLSYFLGRANFRIKDIADKYNLKIINLMDKNILEFYTIRVEEFIYLIDNASLVCTDSFHGTVFSIIMKKPFLTFTRNEKNIVDMMSRIDTLLELFNLKERMIINDEIIKDIFNMNFDGVDDILEKEKIKALDYFYKAFNLETKL